MKTIEARYRIVTPMFIGGADSTPSDGIRPPSFRGALRFWWRALNWGKYQNLAMLHKKEAELFGSAVKTADKMHPISQDQIFYSPMWMLSTPPSWQLDSLQRLVFWGLRL